MNFSQSLLFCFLLAAGLSAEATILIEPIIAYESGANNLEFTAAGAAIKGSSTAKSTNTAVNYGARLGYVFNSGLWLAGDYTVATSGKSKYETHEDTFSRTSTGADIGIMTGRWNFWVGYNFSDNLTFTQPGGLGDDYGVGTSIKAGFEYLLYYHIALLVDYTMRTYTTGKTTSADNVFADYPTYVKSFTQSSASVGLAFPF